MHDIEDLVEGYHRFFSTRDSEKTQLYNQLAERGQTPRTMVISCCDSRVDPSAIFDAGPGSLFVVRNVANLVPPFEPTGDFHGTSAALEYAVGALHVENIVVMGHARCGGVKAFIDGMYKKRTAELGFIDSWMSLLNPAKARLPEISVVEDDDEYQRLLELDSVRCSIQNLMTFPFVRCAVAEGTLRLRGAYFSIFHGSLLGMDPDDGEFYPVDC